MQIQPELVGIRCLHSQQKYDFRFADSEVDYGRLFENMVSAFGYCKILFDSNGKPVDFKILQVNSAIEKIFGMKKSDIIGKKISEVVPTAISDHSELLETVGRVALTGKAEEFELFLKAVNIWVYTSIFSPKKNYFIFIFENITKRKNYEAELKNSIKRFSDLANSLPDIVFEIDLDGRTTYINQIAFETTGYTQEDYNKGAFNQDFFIPGDLEKARKDFTKAMTTSSTVTNEYVMMKKDGTRFNAIIKAVPIKNGEKVIGLRGILSDITEQKKTTETLVFQSELLEAVGQAVIAADKNHIIRYWNRGAKNLYGWTAEEVLGKSINEFLTAEFVKIQVDEISKSFISGQSWSSEIQVKRRDGNMVPVIVSRNPVFDKAGEFIGAISVYTDITDQKSMELELAGLVEEYAVATEKIKELNEKLRVIGSLTRHDVRNKLAVLDGYTYMLRKKFADNEAAIRYLTKMDEASKQLLDILEFERVYEQIGSEELDYVNVERLFAEASALISDFKGTNVKCECNGLEVLADSLLRQLLYNLMENTLKYGEKTTLIKLYFKKDENSIQLIYEDNGAGITDEVRTHLFEKGFGKGTGLGLYMIKRIIETYGWNMEENGKLGVGVKFIMKIPEKKFRIKN